MCVTLLMRDYEDALAGQYRRTEWASPLLCLHWGHAVRAFRGGLWLPSLPTFLPSLQSHSSDLIALCLISFPSEIHLCVRLSYDLQIQISSCAVMASLWPEHCSLCKGECGQGQTGGLVPLPPVLYPPQISSLVT